MRQISLFLFALLCLSCKKNKVNHSLSLVDYPAAYVVCADNTVSVINLSKLAVETSFIIPDDGTSFAHHIYKSPDNGRLVVALPKMDFSMGHDMSHDMVFGGGLMTIDAKSGVKIAQTGTPVMNHNAIFSPDGSEIWTALMSHQSPRVFVYDAVTLMLKKEIFVGTDPSELIFSSDGKTAFVAAQESSFVYAIDVDSKEIIKQIKVDVYPTNVWQGSDDRLFVENDYRKSVNIIDSKSFKAVAAIDLDYEPGFITAERSSGRIWVCHPKENEVVLYAKNGAGTYEKTTAIKTGEDAHAIAIYEKNNFALVINQRGNTVSVIDLTTLKKVKDITVGKKPNGMVIID